jgi:hypothetical protein
VEKPQKDGVLTSYLKGAPERVLAKCSTYLSNTGLPEPITDDFRKAYDDAYNVSAPLTVSISVVDHALSQVYGIKRPSSDCMRPVTPTPRSIPGRLHFLEFGREIPYI